MANNYKRRLLQERIAKYDNDETFHKKQSTLSKYAAVLAGASAGIAAIAAAVVTVEENLDYGLGAASCAIILGIISYGAYETHEKQTRYATRAHKRLRKAQQSLTSLNQKQK